MGDLYLARVIDVKTIDEPPIELAGERFEDDFAEELEELGIEPAESMSYPTFVEQIASWAKGRSAEQAMTDLGQGIFYNRDVIEALQQGKAPASADLWLAAASWIGHNAMRRAFDSLPPVEAKLVSIQAVTISADAGLPKPGSACNAFCLRLLTEACEYYDKSPIYLHFGKDDEWAQEDFGGKEDDVLGIVPFASCLDWIELKFDDEFKAAQKNTWWAKEADVQALNEPSDNLPYAIGTYEIVTFSGWVPELTRDTFRSRAYGF